MYFVDFKGITVNELMNPIPNNPKYIGRDLVVGKYESERRRALLPKIIKQSDDYCETYNIEKPTLLIVGSTAVNMANEESDLDIAVIVDDCHIFSLEKRKWVSYEFMFSQKRLYGFDVHLFLIIKNHEVKSIIRNSLINNWTN